MRKRHGLDTHAFHGVPLSSFMDPKHHGLPDQFWGWQFGTTVMAGEEQDDSLDATEAQADIAVIIGVGDEDAVCSRCSLAAPHGAGVTDVSLVGCWHSHPACTWRCW